MYKLKKMKTRFKTIEEIKDILERKIFVSENKESYIFSDDTYTVMHGDFSLLIRRNNIVWKNIKSKYKYSIFQYESNFIFRTSENEISPKENEFIISLDSHATGEYSLALISLEDKTERLRLLSD